MIVGNVNANMAATPVLSSDPESLRIILMTLDDIRNYDNLVTYFPFQSILTNPPETVSLLLQILRKILNNSKFLQNTNKTLICTVEFVLTNISYFSNKKDSEELNDLVNYLRSLFSKVKCKIPNDFEIYGDRICDIIFALVKSVDVQYKLKLELVLLLSEMISIPDILRFSNFEIVDRCISECFLFLKDDSLELCLLTAATLRASSQIRLSNKNHLYQWIYGSCPLLLDKIAHARKFVLLDCILLAFRTKKDNTIELTKIFKEKISSLYALLSDNVLYSRVVEIFWYIINDLSKMGELPSISAEYKQSLKTIFENDVILIINYLRYLKSPREIIKEEIICSITHRCLNTNTYPAVILKALCLLFPAYLNDFNIDKVQLEKNILDAAEQSRNIPDIFTHNLAQLNWFLSSKRPNLETSVVEYWLVNYDNSESLMLALKCTNTTHLLLKFLFNDQNKQIQNKAAEFLSRLRCPSMAIFIKKQLPSSLRHHTTMGYLFKAGPALPQSENELLFFCGMFSCVLPLLKTKEAFIGTCTYTSKMLIVNKNCSKALERFMLNENYFIALYGAASRDDDIALPAIKLLIIFFKLQIRYSVNAKYAVAVDFRKLLRGSTTRVSKTLSLLNLSFSTAASKWVVYMKKESILDVYQYLLQLERPDNYADILYTMAKFLKTYCFLSYLTSTAIYIDMHCVHVLQQEEHVRHFIALLKAWLEKLYNKPIHLQSILRHVRLFLKNQPSSDQIKEIMKLKIISQ